MYSVEYSNVWEDQDLVQKYLSFTNNDILVAICSSGDNIFNILCNSRPKKVFAVDMNKKQLDFFILTKIAIEQMDYDNFLEFIGYRDTGKNRYDMYLKLVGIPDINKEVIEKGFKNSGRLESFLSKMKEYDLKEFNIFNKTFMTLFKHGRDENKLSYVKESVQEIATIMYERYMTRKLESPYHSAMEKDNSIIPFVHYMNENNFYKLKANLKHVEFELVDKDLCTFLNSMKHNKESIQFLLSDIFEYMSEETADKCFEVIDECSSAGSNMLYWELLVERNNKIWKRIESNDKDNVFFYRSFKVYKK